jgi:hypothetical protein
VAQGTYYPTTGTDTSVTFKALSGVQLYGGFTNGMTRLAERNWMEYPTILSGDIDRDGLLDADNSRHVFTANTNGVLDGLHLMHGYGVYSTIVTSDKVGSALSCDNGPGFELRNCIVAQNNSGGAAGNYGSVVFLGKNFVISNCIFMANTTVVGGNNFNGTTILNANGSLTGTLKNCLFIRNGCAITIYKGANTTLKVSNCTFTTNVPAGRQIYSWGSPTLTVENSVFWGNGITNVVASSAANYCTVKYSEVQGSGGSTGWLLGTASVAPFVVDAGNNIDKDPLFVGGPTGSWTLAPAYASGRTTLTDANASFGTLRGKFLNAKTGVSSTNCFYILSNSTTQIVVNGNASAVAASGNAYEVMDVHLKPTSPCVDAGNPADPWALEPDSSVKRIDMGFYGNTPEATTRPGGGMVIIIR